MKEKILSYLKEHRGEFTSGEALSDQLGVTRACIWKVMKALKNEGYQIHSVSSKGYLLASSEGVFNQEEIEEKLMRHTLWDKIYYFSQLTSTNDYAKTFGNQSMNGAALIIADEQTKGRGRMGRQWIAPGKTGLWLSLLLRPSFAPTRAAMITQLAALAVCRAIKNVTGLESKIKWPNDILIEDRKVCGILTEINAELSGINHLVIGIGVNVNMMEFHSDIENVATSLALKLGRQIDRLQLLDNIMEELGSLYRAFEKSLSLKLLKDELVAKSSIVGYEVRVQRGQEEIEALAVDIDSEGNLVVIVENQKIAIYYGEVTKIRKIEGKD